MSEQSHVAMHWGRKKKELAIESGISFLFSLQYMYVILDDITFRPNFKKMLRHFSLLIHYK